MTSQKIRSLPDLLEFIVDNRGRTCPVADSGMPLIATNCLKPGRREPVFENVRYVDDNTYAHWFRAHPEPGDVLFVCKGSPGRVAVVPDPVPFCIAQDMVALRANRAVADPGYLYYILRSPQVQASIGNMHVGTMIPHFKKGDFGKLQILVHDSVAEQKAIAEVLGALDDKIAANDRLISVAAELMRSLAMTATGTAPLASLAHQSTASLRPDQFADGEVHHFSLPSFDQSELPDRVRGTVIKSNKFVLTKRCVLVSKLNPRIPRIWDIDPNDGVASLGSTEFVVLVPKEIDASVLWAMLQHPAFSTALASKVAGTSGSHQRVRPAEMLSLDVADPMSLSDSALGQLTAIGQLRRHRRDETESLTRTRDQLLPLLMSGKVRVKDAENIVEEVV